MSLATKFGDFAETQKKLYDATNSTWSTSASHGLDGVAACYFVGKGLQKLCEWLGI